MSEAAEYGPGGERESGPQSEGAICDDAFRFYDPDTDPFGPDGYPLAWHNEIKDAVRELNGNRCLRCKHPYVKGANPLFQEPGEDGQLHYTSWSPCDIECEHDGPIRFPGVTREWNELESLYERTAGWLASEVKVEAKWRILTVHHLDGVKANLSWWNLVPLCQRCHLTVQRKVQMARVWLWEHSDWMKPFVAGYYAYVYLGEQLSRDEVESKMGELLALERMA